MCVDWRLGGVVVGDHTAHGCRRTDGEGVGRGVGRGVGEGVGEGVGKGVGKVVSRRVGRVVEKLQLYVARNSRAPK